MPRRKAPSALQCVLRHPGAVHAGVALASVLLGGLVGWSLRGPEPTDQQASLEPLAVGVSVTSRTPAPVREPRRAARPRMEEPTWRGNAVAPPPTQGQALVAVVIDDLGLDRARSQAALALPGPLTAAFLPYAPNVAAQAKAARRAGHELMVHMGMEPANPHIDPGPMALRVGMDAATLRATMGKALAQFDGYVGLNNHMGSLLTADRDAMTVVLDEAKRRGLLFLDSRTTADSVAGALARTLDVPHAERSVFLDHERTPEAVRTQLNALAAKARQTGFAIGIGHPVDVTIAALREWLPTLEAQGIAMVPLSTIVALQQQKQIAAR